MYVADKRSGQGRYSSYTGNTYIGDFKNGKYDGKIEKGEYRDDQFCP